MHRGRNQVERTLLLLRNGFWSDSNEDTQLLKDLRNQLSVYSSNFQVGCANSEVSQNISCALPYLSQKITGPSTSTNSSQTSTTTTHIDNNNDSIEKNENGITSSIINGTRVYFLDGKEIQFKVWKNKPKNGDFEVRWNRSLDTLKEFQGKYGHTRATRSTPGYRELGNWVAEQRRKLKNGKITQKQFETLNELGFEWDRSAYFFNTHKQKTVMDSDDAEND